MQLINRKNHPLSRRTSSEPNALALYSIARSQDSSTRAKSRNTPVNQISRKLPKESSARLAKMVAIYRDTYGVPHVFGRTDASTFFGFAYAQAEDNFLRVEENFISLTWPLVTVFGFIAQPQITFSSNPTSPASQLRESGFDFKYNSRPSWDTYANLLEFADVVKRDLRDLRPRDMIDIQSFMWVQGSEEYEE